MQTTQKPSCQGALSNEPVPLRPPAPMHVQALQQGGVVIFEGERLIYAHYDPSIGAHADLEELLKAALHGWVAQ
jgi:hypothetical protein